MHGFLEFTEDKSVAEGYYGGKHRSAAWHADGGANDEGWDDHKPSYSSAHKPADHPHAVHINGKKWKTFGSQSHATNVARKIKGATVHKEEVELDEANFAGAMKSAIAAHERGDHTRAKYHLDNAKTARYAMKSTEISKHKDLLDKYSELRKMHEEVELAEAKIDKEHPIVKEYDSLKKNHDIKSLRGLIKGQQRIVDTSEFKTKDHAISHYLRNKHGNKKVDQAFGFSEETKPIQPPSERSTAKHRILVTYSDPHHTAASMRKEKQQKHIRVPATDKRGNTVYQGEAQELAKKYMKKQGYKVHDTEHAGLVTKTTEL